MSIIIPDGGTIGSASDTDAIAISSGGNVTISQTLDGGAIGSAVTMSANQACVKTALNASGDAPIYACRAWVNFNGSGTIRDSGNVSSVDEQVTGIYKINFQTAMPDADYSCAGFCGSGHDRNIFISPATSSDNASVTEQTTSDFWVKVISTANVLIDTDQIQLIVIR